MAWVWYGRLDTAYRPAEVDDGSPVHPAQFKSFERAPLTLGTPAFKIKAPLKSVEKLHCPPVGLPPAVDVVWQQIILNYVPQDLVQFIPIRINCRDGTSERYSLVLPLAPVRCIDPERSDVTSKIEREDTTLIFGCDFYVHHPDCLNGNHLARDEQKPSHIVISNELRDALAATGESSMFYQPEDLPLPGGRILH
ncbi:hypothetical protein SAMN05518861_111124 [Mesorhizobium sp. YR577]|nr:hypothetical protein SAMN05518861_111124 [Mesorhizobium sp. YR577]